MSRPPLSRSAMLVFGALCLAACSSERDGESAEDFAAQIGTGEADASPSPVATVAVEAPPPAGVDVRALEQLGNIAGVDLGPRDGGCTFQSGWTDLLIAAAPADPASAGRAVVRAGGKLYLLTSAGGLPAIRGGARFSGEGITVDVAGSGQAAKLTVTDAEGRSSAFSGRWICA